MSTHTPDKSATVVPLGRVSKDQPADRIVADDSGRAIVALLQKAAQMAKEDCARAMELAHKLASQLRSAEEKARELEVEVAHFRDRAARAEEWLVRIHNEVEDKFFQKRTLAPGPNVGAVKYRVPTNAQIGRKPCRHLWASVR